MPGRIRNALRELSHRQPRVRGFQHRIGALMLPQFKARHWERSLILSADDDVGPSDRLLDVAFAAAAAAREIRLEELRSRETGPPYLAEVWPGIHYRFLAGLVETLSPTCVIEIGTATGMSALSMLTRLPAGSQLATFDIVPWSDYPGTTLVEADFSDGRLVQHVDDLSDRRAVERHRDLLSTAELIFIDARHDGVQERLFMNHFATIPFEQPPLLVFDDIRQWDMIGFWRSITQPKLDITSFGSWSGTGLVDLAG